LCHHFGEDDKVAKQRRETFAGCELGLTGTTGEKFKDTFKPVEDALAALQLAQELLHSLGGPAPTCFDITFKLTAIEMDKEGKNITIIPMPLLGCDEKEAKRTWGLEGVGFGTVYWNTIFGGGGQRGHYFSCRVASICTNCKFDREITTEGTFTLRLPFPWPYHGQGKFELKCLVLADVKFKWSRTAKIGTCVPDKCGAQPDSDDSSLDSWMAANRSERRAAWRGSSQHP